MHFKPCCALFEGRHTFWWTSEWWLHSLNVICFDQICWADCKVHFQFLRTIVPCPTKRCYCSLVLKQNLDSNKIDLFFLYIYWFILEVFAGTISTTDKPGHLLPILSMNWEWSIVVLNVFIYSSLSLLTTGLKNSANLQNVCKTICRQV